jgi:serine/threonine protein kinase/tetratricopeptide (TPR) repeat protein
MSNSRLCPGCGKEIGAPETTCPSCGMTLDLTGFTAAGGAIPGPAPGGAASGPAPAGSMSDPTLAAPPPGGAEEQALAVGRVLGGRYEILGVVGKGGMGWVYKARDREIDRLVALKVIRQDLAKDETVLARFRDEIVLARSVTHRNVLRIFDISDVEGIKLISMPYVEGKDLKTLILEKGPLAVEEAVGIARQVADALRCAHEAGVIHRDLKPQNILIDEGGNALVTDFGIAKSAECGGLTVTGQIIGTPEYMSPEQAEGAEVDYRTDIYSFGLVLYEMLTGQVVFKADTIISTLMKRLRERPPAPSSLNPSVPAWLDKLTAKALERNLADRYGSIADLIADIDTQTVKVKRRLRPRTVGIIAAVVGLGVLGALIAVLKPSLVFHQARTYLAILPFENTTGDGGLDWLVSGIPDNLTADLAQSKYFRIMSTERLRQVVEDMGRDATDLASADIVRRLARATDLDAVALGSFIRSGAEVRISLKVEDARSQEIIGSTMVKGTEADLLAMIDELTRATKQIFKLSRRAIDADLDRDVALQRTRSVKAASDFARGLDLAHQGSYLEAVRAFQSAIEADPDFAIAYGKAAEAYKDLGYDDKAESLSFAAVERVVKFMDRVPAADRAFIMAGHADITHNTEEAVRSYQDFVSAYPDDPEGYYKLGVTYDAVSEWAPAAANFRKAIELDPKFASARFGLARVLINQNSLGDALRELDEALRLYRDLGNREGEATVLNAIGVVYNRQNDYEKAIEYYRASIKIKEELDDKRGIAASLGNLGLVYEIVGKRDQALEVLNRSLEIKREIGDKMGISTALNKIGQIYQSDGRFDEALANFERSCEIRREIGSKDLTASSLSDMAAVYSLMGKYDKSIELDSMALALRQEVGDVTDQVRSLINMAGSLADRGAAPRARALLNQAASMAAELGDARLAAKIDEGVGQFHLAEGRVDSALVFLDRAYRAQVSLEDKPAAAATTVFLGEALGLKAEYTKALRDFDAAITLAGEVREREVAAMALVGKAELFYQAGYAPGLDSLVAALDLYDKKSLSYQLRCRLDLLRALGMCAARRWGDAMAASDAARAAVGPNDVRSHVVSLLVRGLAAAGAGRAAQAQADLESARAEAHRYGLRDLEVRGLLALGRTLSQSGKGAEGLALCEEALQVAAETGISQAEYLLACGGAALAAGDGVKAASYYERGLAEAASVVERRCPRRLRSYYVARLSLGQHIADLSGLPGSSEREAAVRRYETTFGLK